MRVLALTVLLGFVFVQSSVAELSVKQYKAIIASRNQDRIQTTRAYVLGLGEGMRNMNVALFTLTEARIFCPPAKLQLGVENFTDILDQAIKDMTSKLGETKVGELDISTVMLRGLVDTFQCQGER